jgi:hypothetical protein
MRDPVAKVVVVNTLLSVLSLLLTVQRKKFMFSFVIPLNTRSSINHTIRTDKEQRFSIYVILSSTSLETVYWISFIFRPCTLVNICRTPKWTQQITHETRTTLFCKILKITNDWLQIVWLKWYEMIWQQTETRTTIENKLESGIAPCFQFAVQVCDHCYANDSFHVFEQFTYINIEFCLSHTYPHGN